MKVESDDINVTTTTHWGCQFIRPDGRVYLTRWDPGYGSGVYVPYTEAEARADVGRKDHDWPHTKRLVTRTETVTTVTTPWVEVRTPPASTGGDDR